MSGIQTVLAIATFLGGVAAIWFFWDKYRGRGVGNGQSPRTSADSATGNANHRLSDGVTPAQDEGVRAGQRATSMDDEAVVASGDPSYSPMTMEEYFDSWFNKATTSLQRHALEEKMKSRRVVWSGVVDTVKADAHVGIRMTVHPVDGSYGTAFLDFDDSQKAQLVEIHQKQHIRSTGVIRNFVSSPFLSDCRIIRVLK
jgi:hypothetical protein